jgi:hypothetical protein
MTPKFRGVPSALAKLQHSLDADAEKLFTRIERANQRREEVFKKSHASLDAADGVLDDVEKFFDNMEGSNGGPSGSSDEESEEQQAKTAPPRSSEVASR